MKQYVESRRYKGMLKKNRSTGLKTNLLKHANVFWHAFKKLIHNTVFNTDGDLNKITKQRFARFYDGADYDLRKDEYVFWEQINLNANGQVTFKFCHPDQYYHGQKYVSSQYRNRKNKI